MIVVLMGVTGSGKTTVGRMLARSLACPFLEGDALHSPENVDKMSRGVALTDADRAPWLAAIRARIVESLQRGEDLVVACSALKQAYRRMLGKGIPVAWVYLMATPALLRSRLRLRRGHFMKAEMLASQLETLEEPSDALVVDVSNPPAEIVERILAELRGPDRSAAREARRDVRVFATLDELSVQAAKASVGTINNAVRARGRCSVVLSGGNTPRTLYTLLAADFHDRIPWADVHVFWADERYVPADDAASNYRMAKEALLDHVPCPAGNIHPMPTHFASPHAAARAYDATLRAHFHAAWPSFDLMYLGIGEEGHTASLFPGSPGIEEADRGVIAVETPSDPPLRITLTLPALLRAANIHVLVAGPEKSGALRHVLTGVPDPSRWPAAGVRYTAGALIWWVDRAAAADLYGQFAHVTRAGGG
jgi:6-phosphogluconolactonase